MQEDDGTLLRRYAGSGDQIAFTEFVRRNMDAVYSAALRRVGGEAALAQDVAQQVFVKVARRAEALAAHPVLAAWLYTATRHAAINAVRAESRRRQREQEVYAMSEILPHQRNGVDWERTAPVLDEIIDALGESDRRALLLRFFGRRTHAEIAAVLRVTEDAARMRIERALEKMRVRLSRRGIGSTAGALAAALTQHSVLAAPTGLAEATASEALTALTHLAPAAGWLRWERFAAAAGVAIFLASVGVVVQRERLLRAETATLQTETQELTALEHRTETGAARAAASPQRVPGAEPVALGPSRAQPERRAGGRRLEVAASYDGLYRELGLSPVQIEQFEEILIRRAGATVWTYELSPLDSAALAPIAPERPEVDVEGDLRALLGPTDYDRYRTYSRALPAKNLAARLASAVYLTEPLTVAQGEELNRLISQASDAYRAGGTIERAALNWDALLADAGRMLSAGQLAALGGAVRQEEAYLIALMQRLKATPPAGLKAEGTK